MKGAAFVFFLFWVLTHTHGFCFLMIYIYENLCLIFSLFLARCCWFVGPHDALIYMIMTNDDNDNVDYNFLQLEHHPPQHTHTLHTCIHYTTLHSILIESSLS